MSNEAQDSHTQEHQTGQTQEHQIARRNDKAPAGEPQQKEFTTHRGLEAARKAKKIASQVGGTKSQQGSNNAQKSQVGANKAPWKI